MAVERGYVVDIGLSIEGPWFETTWFFPSSQYACVCRKINQNRWSFLSGYIPEEVKYPTLGKCGLHFH